MGGVCRAGDLRADHRGPGHPHRTYRCGLYPDHGQQQRLPGRVCVGARTGRAGAAGEPDHYLRLLCQFALAAKLSLFRRVFTPTVAGTVLMLIPITIGPLILGKLADVPAGASPAAAPVSAGVTLVIIVVIALRGAGAWRLWAPVAGIGAGSLIGGLGFGIYDTTRILEAAWVGLPTVAWPGLDLSFGPTFWALLPAFVLVTLAGALDTIGDTIGIQQISWRRPRAIDFRSIQGALNADGLGNLLSGLRRHGAQHDVCGRVSRSPN